MGVVRPECPVSVKEVQTLRVWFDDKGQTKTHFWCSTMRRSGTRTVLAWKERQVFLKRNCQNILSSCQESALAINRTVKWFWGMGNPRHDVRHSEKDFEMKTFCRLRCHRRRFFKKNRRCRRQRNVFILKFWDFPFPKPLYSDESEIWKVLQPLEINRAVRQAIGLAQPRVECYTTSTSGTKQQRDPLFHTLICGEVALVRTAFWFQGRHWPEPQTQLNRQWA